MDAHALLASLLHTLPTWAWKGALLAALATAADALLRRRSPSLRHLVATAAVVGLLLLPLLDGALPALAVPVPGEWLGQQSPMASAPQATLHRAPPAMAAPAAEQTLTTVTIVQMSRSSTPAAAPAAPSITATEMRAVAPQPPTLPRLDAATVLALVWLTGALLVALRLALALRRRAALRRSARPLHGDWPDLLRECAGQLAIERPVLLVQSHDTEVPMTWGVRRPVVLLPASAGRWPQAQRRSVLLHELAHVRRRDALSLLLAHVVCLLHWFDPLVWLAARRVRDEAELACDDLVLLAGSRPSLYAGHLLEVARALRSALPSPLLTLPMARRAKLSSRIAAILDGARERRPARAGAVVATVAVVALLVLALAAAAPRAMAEDAPAIPAQAALPALPALPVQPATAPVAPTTALDARPVRGPILPLPPGASLLPKLAEATAAPAVSAASAASVPVVADDLDEGPPVPPVPPVPPAPPAPPSVWHAARPAAGSFPTPPAPPAPPASPVPPAPPAPPADFSAWARGCNQVGDQHHSNWAQVDDDNWRVRVRAGSCRLEIDMDGKVEVAPDEASIARIAPGGRFRLYENRDGHERELVAKPAADGTVLATFELDGDRRPFDAAARAWLAQLLPEVYRQTGLDAAGRVGRLLKRGGPDAVTAEVLAIGSDSVQGMYLRELLRQARLDAHQVDSIVGLAARELSSDYDLAETLVAALGTQPAAAVVGPSFGAACAAIDSDYDLRRVLEAVVQHSPDTTPVGTTLACARGIGSDYDRAELLVAVSKRWPAGKPLPAAFFPLATSLHSDYDRRRSLEAVVEKHPLTSDDVRQILAAASAFSSDYDLAELLVAVAHASHLEGDLADAYRRAANEIHSDYDRTRALAAMGEAPSR